MNKNSFIFVFASIFLGCMIFFAPAFADNTTTTNTDLQAELIQKEQQISSINQQLSSAQSNLKSVQSQGISLQQQVNLINGNINTLNLSMQADALTAQQLQLQIQQLNSDQGTISSTIANDEEAIGTLLQEMQKNDTTNGNLLMTFLKKGTLAEGVMEAQSLGNLQSKISLRIDDLKGLHQKYNTQIQDSAAKAARLAIEQQDLENKASILQDEQAQKQALLTSTKNQEVLFQQQLSTLQQQQAAINAEIDSIDAQLRTQINPTVLPTTGAGVLMIPINGDTKADVTQGYGATAFARSEYVHHWHNGLDFAASIGTPVLAAADGTIAAAANEDLYCPHGAYGKFITINHANGLTTLYGHLSKIIVTPGQVITRGQVIGYSGSTGDVTGPHLHFTVFAQSTYSLGTSKSCGPLPQGGDVNPSNYLF